MKTAFWFPLIAMLMLATVLSAALLRDNANPSAVASPLTGQAAPDLDVDMLDTGGKHLTNATLMGKPHLLNFFASWCGPCAMENATLMKLSQQHKVDIIGVAMKDNVQPLVQYLAQRGNPYDLIGLDETGHTAIDWGVSGIPETFAINAQGRIIDHVIGGLGEADAQRLVDSLLTK